MIKMTVGTLQGYGKDWLDSERKATEKRSTLGKCEIVSVVTVCAEKTR